MVGIIPTFAILFANIQTVWLLRWGYELKSLSIEMSILAIAVFAIEMVEFQNYRDQQPKFMAVHEYIPRTKKRIAAVMGVD